MQCNNKLYWRKRIITKYNAKPPDDLPKWLVPFMTGTHPSSISCGSYKAVYVMDDRAISVEETDEDSDDDSDDDLSTEMEIRNRIIRDRLNRVEEKYQKYFNYSKNEWVWQGFRFRELSVCPKGTLADMMDSDPYTLQDVHLKQLIRALQALHKVELTIGDLKPENIMFCACDCLAFIDLDSAVIMPIDKESRIYRTRWWNIISRINPKKVEDPRTLLIASDWIAISLVVMMHYAVKEDDTELSSSVISSHNKSDFNYEYIKGIYTDEIYVAAKLARAAHDIIKHFRLYDDGSFSLPDRKYIDKLLEVSWSHHLQRIVQNALRF